MFTEIDGTAPDRARGAELARAAEALVAEAALDTIDVTQAARIATANALLALYWELRNQHPGPVAETARCLPCPDRRATEPGA